ncbi:trace amine-associated receptor 2-like [Paramacrobiotus metropolitanus]|uniref:trace amine-associated receptor 2-like n=1 Tax=Paramacrobiotus metropolitanus TaxID=2943436 RepID=UPI0024458874|nr:trace amine-associated receptor 2-like [Paramacrobiotus metropolitanus]
MSLLSQELQYPVKMAANMTLNNTTPAAGDPLAAWIMIPITITTLAANVLLITLYAKSSHLHTPFAVYIVSSASGDIAQAFTVHIHSIVTVLSIKWPFGQPFCTFILYTTWLFVSFSYHMHVLICVNRLWAVMFPAHYRHYHDQKVAIFLVTGMLVYLNLWILPGFAIHVMYYAAADGIPVCIPSYPDQLTWSNSTYVALYIVPESVILVIYPVILIRIYWRTKFHARNRAVRDVTDSTSAQRKSLPSSKQNSSGSVSIPFSIKRSRTPRAHFALLTALVLLAVACWTPVSVAYVLVSFEGLLLYNIMTPCTIVYFLDGLLNPGIFLLASREWRETMRKKFS